jgi:hypothetical protein
LFSLFGAGCFEGDGSFFFGEDLGDAGGGDSHGLGDLLPGEPFGSHFDDAPVAVYEGDVFRSGHMSPLTGEENKLNVYPTRINGDAKALVKLNHKGIGGKIMKPLERRRSFLVLMFLGAGCVISLVNAEGALGKGKLYRYSNSFAPSHLLVFGVIAVVWTVLGVILARVFVR